MRLLVDSSFVIDYLRDEPAAVARWREVFGRGDEPVINEIVVCEVRAGVRAQAVAQFEAFLEPIEFVQPGPRHALLAGDWRARARATGHHLSLADALIAAAADAVHAAVLTRNVRDFTMTPVRIETY
ncbi:MAG: PIN domain-containing protein [Chloroflexota bacterium]